MRFTLHGHFESGNVYKVALMLALCDQPYTYVHVPIFDGGAKTPAHKQKNRFGEVPVLEDHARGLTLVQSGVILLELARELRRYAPPDERPYLEWLAWENHRLSPTFVRARFLRRFAKPAPHEAVLAYHDAGAAAALATLDATLAQTPFVLGAAPSIADILCAGYMWFFDETGADASTVPHVMAWRARLEALPGWQHPRALLPTGTA